MAASKTSLPAISPDGNLSRYLEQIRSFPMLEQQQEYMLAKSWKERGDVDAAHQLVTSHLRLVAKIAMGYRGYGLPVADLISEGNLGMMHAVKKFEPEKGFRLATYAMWWIKAAIQEYILRSWSLVKIGTTAGQKKLFFNLRRIKGQIQAIDDGDLKPEQVTQIATQLDVSEAEVISMNQRMAGNDRSLNVPLSRDGEGSGEWQDWLEDDSEDQETTFAEHEEFSARKRLMLEAMQGLNEREQRILQARRLAEPPLTLEDLASEFGVSRERIRQIEVRAFEKLQKAVRDKAEEMKLLPSEEGRCCCRPRGRASPPATAVWRRAPAAQNAGPADRICRCRPPDQWGAALSFAPPSRPPARRKTRRSPPRREPAITLVPLDGGLVIRKRAAAQTGDVLTGQESAGTPPQRLINNPPSGSLSVGNLRGGRVTVLGVTEETILPGTTKGP